MRQLSLDLENLNVFSGKNGAGKTNLYRSLQLVQAAALGTFAREIAAEGGMGAVLWAGRRQRNAAAVLKLSIDLAAGRDERVSYTYEIEAGVPSPSAAAFPLEPQIKSETITFHHRRRKHVLLKRRGPSVEARDRDGETRQLATDLLASETALAGLDEPGAFPDQHLVRKTLSSWRFYHDLRTDAESPLRKPCLATTALSLNSDGGNLAAVFATLRHIRADTNELDEAVESAFGGARLIVEQPIGDARFGMSFPEFVLDGGSHRVFDARELSDGTLRFLGLAGALFAYHRPPFVALNEPESSLHPELIYPLAQMIVAAADQSQVWIVTHSSDLCRAIETLAEVSARPVTKQGGATMVE